MKIVIDMNLSPLWMRTLEEAGHETIHWSRIGPPNAPDRLIFKWAQENGYLILTHDLDFGAMLAATHSGTPSVIQIRTEDTRPSHIGGIVLRLLSGYEEQLTAGAFIVFDEARHRIRILPF